MAAFNVVRFRVKPGREDEFLQRHRDADAKFAGLLSAAIVKTGERTFCFIGEWSQYTDIAAARPQMIALLDSFRDTLEDLGAGLGLTDPVSGEVVVKLR